MHELAVAQALVGEVEAVIDRHAASRNPDAPSPGAKLVSDAPENGAWCATRIRVRIGPLAGVVPALLAQALPLAAAGSRMAGAELELVEAPVRVRCQTCGAETDAALNRLMCGECGDWHTQLVSGDELLLESVELESVPACIDTPI